MDKDKIKSLNIGGLYQDASVIDYPAKIKQLFEDTNYAVLCTSVRDTCHGALVAFAHTEDLLKVYFATPKTTQKYSNIINNPHIAMLFDNRLLRSNDIGNIEAVTAKGTASLLNKQQETEVFEILQKKHAYLNNFFGAESVSLVALDVDEYLYVTHFQEVYSWIPK